MDETRTYGIEVEVISKVSPSQLQDMLRIAFQAANLNMAVRVGGYGHDINGNNRDVWNLKRDASISSDDTNYPHGIEIVSPVLTGLQGLRALKVVCEAIHEVTKVNKSTGLHVHHGVRAEDLAVIAKSWIAVYNQKL